MTELIIPENSMVARIVVMLGDDGMCISDIVRELNTGEKAQRKHRLTVTGYLRCMEDLGLVESVRYGSALVYRHPYKKAKIIIERID